MVGNSPASKQKLSSFRSLCSTSSSALYHFDTAPWAKRSAPLCVNVRNVPLSRARHCRHDNSRDRLALRIDSGSLRRSSPSLTSIRECKVWPSVGAEQHRSRRKRFDFEAQPRWAAETGLTSRGRCALLSRRLAELLKTPWCRARS
jgi:hypothetical protein